MALTAQAVSGHYTSYLDSPNSQPPEDGILCRYRIPRLGKSKGKARKKAAEIDGECRPYSDDSQLVRGSEPPRLSLETARHQRKGSSKYLSRIGTFQKRKKELAIARIPSFLPRRQQKKRARRPSNPTRTLHPSFIDTMSDA